MPISLPQCVLIVLCLIVVGCGTSQQRLGTEQLLLSDSVDRAVDQMDCTALSGRKVFLDTTYVNLVKGLAFVNSDYIISALRHKLTISGCLLQDSKANADYIVEARVGALGTDSLEVTYGMPANNALSQAASLVTSVPAAPTIPEISVGKRNGALSTSKIAMYAYHRESGTPVWQSGASVAKSDAKESWFMGAGPLQRGSIYKEPTFAGMRINRFGWFKSREKAAAGQQSTIANARQFVHPAVLEQQIAEAKMEEEKQKVMTASQSKVVEEAAPEKKE